MKKKKENPLISHPPPPPSDKFNELPRMMAAKSFGFAVCRDANCRSVSVTMQPAAFLNTVGIRTAPVHEYGLQFAIHTRVPNFHRFSS